jgi:hypothetical protein
MKNRPPATHKESAEQFQFLFVTSPPAASFRQTEFPWRIHRSKRSSRHPNFEKFKRLRELLQSTTARH